MQTVQQNTERSKKPKRNYFRLIFGRLGIITALLLLQLLVLFGILEKFAQFLPHVFFGSILFIAAMVLYLINSRLDASAKVTWLVLIILAPVFGSLLLLYTQTDVGHRAVKARMHQIVKDTANAIPQDPQTLEAVLQERPHTYSLTHYLNLSSCFPVYRNTQTVYFPSGEAKFAELLVRLEEARHFIFLEYFIIRDGEMWGTILEILARKVREGIDVRVMYDGTCEFSDLPYNYVKQIQALGIRCKAFAPITPFISTHYNYRDHRKILVIDGHTAFTGGVNLADEYINRLKRFGHWKDTAVMLRGEAVRSFTLMFLQMWNVNERKPVYEPFLSAPIPDFGKAKGYVIPYGDCPLDGMKVGEAVYMDILNRSQRYVHIMTPYLILDGEMETALRFAAQRGVDVTLILPGIPDKQMPYALAKTHYPSLLEAGVSIYEYTPGFVHAKVFVSDDAKAVVGTINLDYRSLYHHFECAAYLDGTACIGDIETDFQETLKYCARVTKESLRAGKPFQKLAGVVLKSIAPLL